MDWNHVFKIAVFTVGVTQLAKQFASTKSSRAKAAIAVVSGTVGGLILHFLPQEVFLTIVGIAVGVLFYDSILKSIEKVISEIGNGMKKEDI